MKLHHNFFYLGICRWKMYK